MGLDVLDAAVGFVIDVAGVFAKSVYAPFVTSSKKATIRLIVEHYYKECMSVQCLQGVHTGKGLIGGIGPGKKQLNRCQGSSFAEADLSSGVFQQARLQSLVLQFGTL